MDLKLIMNDYSITKLINIFDTARAEMVLENIKF